ncbi:hypothetical protein GCM10023196_103230 [Actinoallomurus vinaceus]|uniref:CBM2 domain-containing protein n=1 Tax=Actinoallomurus vinaceus TaxID=1080074 RepID=A0ABP8UWN5_9ACTN
MRTFAITALFGTGLLGLAPQAQAASHARPGNPQPLPARPAAENAAHARKADPHAIRPAAQNPAQAPAAQARPAAHARLAAHAGKADPQPSRSAAQNAGNSRAVDAQTGKPAVRNDVRVQTEDPQAGRPAAQHLVHVRPVHAEPDRPQNPVHGRPRDPGPQPQPSDRPSYAMHMTGQAQHWEVSPGELETVRWTLTNTGNRPLDHVMLVAAIPAGWGVREGQGCTRHSEYLGCDLGSLEPGRSSAILVPMVAQGRPGSVRLAAWSRATAGSLTIPGPTTSFRVEVTGRK